MQFQFEDFASFLAMNGHGPFVWAAYGVALLVLGALVALPLLRQKKLRREFDRQLRQEEARRRAAVQRQERPEPATAD
ncbi:heme exporter protein CcmD [Microbulbifer hydrolyticus]|uniref:Heme exporter protein D n=1 Tax=Microbulbifer hydrolyticus TaxID=48074 RepID=A0A6P1TB04_9GAMM|nr:heme exporter protein CcmD [Microbulbifer hydrolyticus]MBB5210735.1 heme exporter protein D [Microbulbifer hydrolyticus]QHQ38816.1 heme exporter protein CcmD [Microbulbifer hydrolyticus]